MKKIILFSILFTVNPVFAHVSEVFQGQDINMVKAGISKYILQKGGAIDHGGSYESNSIRAMEKVREKYGTYSYIYSFNITPLENGVKVDLSGVKKLSGGEAQPLGEEIERIVMNNILNSSKGRFLYGLGFDFDYYNTQTGSIKAPKGKETGIKITNVKYDAQKQGLQAGDVIVKINGRYLKDIPIDEYAAILHAKSLTDTVELTYIRNGIEKTVILSPRLSNPKVF